MPAHPLLDASSSRWPRFIAALTLAAVALTTSASAAPTVITPAYPAADVIIADYVVGTVAGTDPDYTTEIQSKIDACANNGGGTVWIRSGTFRLNAPLTIKPAVTLRGDWRNPADSGQTGHGTLLKCMVPTSNTTPFITLQPSSGLVGVGVWYPNQSATAPIVYPWTIFQAGGGDGGTIENVTLYNSYNGIRMGPTKNTFLTVNNLHMTALNTGIQRDLTYDVARFHRVRISPDVWLDSGLSGTPTRPQLENHLLNGTAPASNPLALDLRHYAWTWMYDWEVKGYKTGVRAQRTLGVTNDPGDTTLYGKNGGPCGGFVKFKLLQCKTGMRLTNTNPQGFNLIDGIVDSSVADAVGIIVETGIKDSYADNPTLQGSLVPDNYRGVVQINRVEFRGALESGIDLWVDDEDYNPNPSHAVRALTVANCIFNNHDSASGYDIRAWRGALVVTRCDFNTPSRHAYVGNQAISALFQGNRYGAGVTPDFQFQTGYAATQPRVIDAATIDLDRYSTTRFTFQDKRFLPPAGRRGASALYLVESYFTAADAAAANTYTAGRDLTYAFQAALAAASTAGGGTVRVPAGEFLLNGRLVVPTNVELRGTFGVPHYAATAWAPTSVNTPGSALHTTASTGAAGFIRLEAGSGIRGLRIHHPGQIWDDNLENTGAFTPYPWAIEARGTNVVVKDVTFTNAYRGVDLGAVDTSGHYVEGVMGTALKEGIRVDRCATGGFIKNTHFIGTFWSASRYPNRPTNYESIRIAATRGGFNAYLYGHAPAQQTLHTFVFGSDIGMKLVAGTQPNGSAGTGMSGCLVAHGTDESETSVKVDDIGTDLYMVNFQLVSMSGFDDHHHLWVGASANGKLTAFNTLAWGFNAGPRWSVRVGSGNINLQQYAVYNHGTDYGVWQNGGTLRIASPYFRADRAGEQGPYGILQTGLASARVFGPLHYRSRPLSELWVIDAGLGTSASVTNPVYHHKP